MGYFSKYSLQIDGMRTPNSLGIRLWSEMANTHKGFIAFSTHLPFAVNLLPPSQITKELLMDTIGYLNIKTVNMHSPTV